MRTIALALAALTLLALVVPPMAEARLPLPCQDPSFRQCFPPWDCVQVYPWSRLCEGDVGGFVDALLEPFCPRASCLA